MRVGSRIVQQYRCWRRCLDDGGLRSGRTEPRRHLCRFHWWCDRRGNRNVPPSKPSFRSARCGHGSYSSLVPRCVSESSPQRLRIERGGCRPLDASEHQECWASGDGRFRRNVRRDFQGGRLALLDLHFGHPWPAFEAASMHRPPIPHRPSMSRRALRHFVARTLRRHRRRVLRRGTSVSRWCRRLPEW